MGASHQFTTAANIPGLAIGEKVYITGVSGTAATTPQQFGPRDQQQDRQRAPYLTLATTTTGLTASGGTAYEYPQATDALTWAGEFDVPCRFDTDELRHQMLESGPGRRVYHLASVPVVEIRT